MTKKTRRILFYAMILAFLLGGTGIVFYAQGWRLDWSTWSADKVGAIYVRSYPPNADILLDGKPERNRTGFFQTGTLVNSLFPKKYTLTLTAPEYRRWERTVQVMPSFVTEVQHAVLVPEVPDLVLPGNARNFWLLGDQPIIQGADGKLSLQDQVLPGDSVTGWTAGFDRILTYDSKSASYHWTDPANSTSTNVTALLRRLGVRMPQTGISIDPENTSQLLLQSSSSLAYLDLQRDEIVPIATSTPGAATSTPTVLTASAGSRFWVAWSDYDKTTDTSRLYLYDKYFGTKRTVGTPVSGRTVKIKWAGNSTLGFFQDDGEFFVYNPSSGKPQHIASDVQDFVFTADGSQVVTLGRVDLEVFSFRDRDEYRRIHLPEAHRITGLAWYKDGKHLFVSYPASTGFLDLDDRYLENFTSLAPTNRTVYDPPRNQFYYLDQGKLMRVDFPQ